ncbi:hypothetical protein GCM10022420_090580 [Streptomyces iranensis]
MASSPASTNTPDSTVGIGLIALEQPCGLVWSFGVVAPELRELFDERTAFPTELAAAA